METALFHTIYVLIQAALLAIVVAALVIIVKGKAWARVLLFILAVVAIGLLGFSTGINANRRVERRRFRGEFVQPHRMMMQHLSTLLEAERYEDAKTCVAALGSHEFRFHPDRDEPHTNYMDRVMGLVRGQSE